MTLVNLKKKATSAFDSESELGIQRAIYSASEECCVVMIAHRLSTVKSANRIQKVLVEIGQTLEMFEILVKFTNFFPRSLKYQNFLLLVLNEGQLIEDGSFNHLVSLENGVFRNLVETQAIMGHKQETKQ